MGLRDVSKVDFLALFTFGRRLTGRLCVVVQCVREGGRGAKRLGSHGECTVRAATVPSLVLDAFDRVSHRGF